MCEIMFWPTENAPDYLTDDCIWYLPCEEGDNDTDNAWIRKWTQARWERHAEAMYADPANS